MSKMSWTEEEIDFLRNAYQVGLSLKEMGYFLNRSVTAINKALHRFSIRKKEIRLKKPKDTNGDIRQEMMESIMQMSKRRGQALDCLRLERSAQKDYLAQGIYKDRRNFRDLSADVLMSGIYQENDISEKEGYHGSFSSYERVKKKKISYGHLEKFVFFEDVLIWLTQKGFILEKVHHEFISKDVFHLSRPLYKLTGPFYEAHTHHSFKTESQLLLFANKIRLKEALPLFYVFDVTAE
ncbi:MAG: hypothetical protein JSS34_01915 [Proteobacteria bacterium]|nr:hypothetical protein [Pseudomonadota bacterium]